MMYPTQPDCPLPTVTDRSAIALVTLDPVPSPMDLHAALSLAERIAEKRPGEAMLLSWYNRGRDFESPQHASECHFDSAVPGYVDCDIHPGATLRIDFEQGRFVFFCLPVEL